MRNPFTILIMFVFVVISLIAFFSVLHIFFPRRIEKTRSIAAGTLGRSFLVGLVNFAFFSAIALGLFALGNHFGGSPAINLIGLLFLIPLAVGLVFGLAGMVGFIGERLFPHSSGLLCTIWGTVALALGCALPFVGWFGLFPMVGLIGLGAFVYSLFHREQRETPEEQDQFEAMSEGT